MQKSRLCIPPTDSAFLFIFGLITQRVKMNGLWHKLKPCGFVNCANWHMNCTCMCINKENRKHFSKIMNFEEIQFIERSENSWRKPIHNGFAVNPMRCLYPYENIIIYPINKLHLLLRPLRDKINVIGVLSVVL